MHGYSRQNILMESPLINQQWYYECNGEQAGPISWDGLMAGIKMGKVTPETRVWASHLSEWTKLLVCMQNNSTPPCLPPQINPQEIRQDQFYQTEFILLEKEQIIIDGVMTYHKSTFGNYNSNCYLTNFRLVVCGISAKGNIALGPIGNALPYLQDSKNIIFQIPWMNLSDLKKGRHGLADKLVFKTKDGYEYSLLPGLKKEQWYLALYNITGIVI